MAEIPQLKNGKTYRLIVRGGYQAPGGQGWSSKPKDGYAQVPPRTVSVKVRSHYVSVEGLVIYQVVDGDSKPRTRSVWAIGHDDVLAAELVQP